MQQLPDSDGNIRDASSKVNDWDSSTLVIEKLESFKSINFNELPKVEKIDSIAPCICKKTIGKFICIGLNYSDHAEETGMTVPPEPIIFFKATSAVIGPNDDVVIPKNSAKSDWEVELGVIIGKSTTRLTCTLWIRTLCHHQIFCKTSKPLYISLSFAIKRNNILTFDRI